MGIAKGKSKLYQEHARMWPRRILTWRPDGLPKKQLPPDLELLTKPGVYILYRDDVPHYIGQAKKLLTRLKLHSKPDARYGLHWNYFSVFVVEDAQLRNDLEAVLIVALKGSNGATPRMKKTRMSREFRHELSTLR